MNFGLTILTFLHLKQIKGGKELCERVFIIDTTTQKFISLHEKIEGTEVGNYCSNRTEFFFGTFKPQSKTKP